MRRLLNALAVLIFLLAGLGPADEAEHEWLAGGGTVIAAGQARNQAGAA